MLLDTSTDSVPYNFSIIPSEDNAQPYTPLDFTRASQKLQSTINETANHARKKVSLAFDRSASDFDKTRASFLHYWFNLDNPAVANFNAKFSSANSVNEKISVAYKAIETSEEIIRNTPKKAPKLRAVKFEPTQIKHLSITDLNKSLLDQMIHLVEKKSSPSLEKSSLDLLETAVKISNLQILIGGPVNHPEELVKQSAVIELKKINDLHEHKLNRDPSFLDRIIKIVDKVLPLDQSTKYNPTSEEGVNGINGSYFAQDDKGKIKGAVFKPYKEQNSLGFNRSGADFGKVAKAAYILDARNQGAAFVPITVEANGRINKSQALSAPIDEARGHLQAFVDNLGPYRNLSYDEKRSIPISEIHRQITFRGRLFDPDAHDENILWSLTSAGTIKLIPIDMDYSLVSLADPSFNRASPYNVLLNTIQANLKYQQSEIEWIDSWDVEGDAEALRNLELPEGSVQLLRFTSWCYQLACRSKTPKEINMILSSFSVKSKVRKEYFSIYENKESQLSSSERDNLFEKNVKKIILQEMKIANPFPLIF